MLGPVTSRLIPGAGLYLINVTDTLARVNATARLFRPFICEFVRAEFFSHHACILEVSSRIGLSIGPSF